MSLAKWILDWQGLSFCLMEVRGIDSRLRCPSVEIGLLRWHYVGWQCIHSVLNKGLRDDGTKWF